MGLIDFIRVSQDSIPVNYPLNNKSPLLMDPFSQGPWTWVSFENKFVTGYTISSPPHPHSQTDQKVYTFDLAGFNTIWKST